MNQISVDQEVIDKLGEIAKPFIETTPNMVIRRLLGLSAQPQVVNEQKATVLCNEVKTSDNLKKVPIPPSIDVMSSEDHYIQIERLRGVSSQTHPAFLTFLMDKYQNTNGNYKISDIMEFMDKANLHFKNNIYRNPWMKTFYRGEKNGLISCQRTIEHFRQARKFGCWGGRDDKSGCSNYACQYHPRNVTKIQNKCDLRNGVIWKRGASHSSYSYGANYLQVVKKELLKNKTIPIGQLLRILYPNNCYSNKLVGKFIQDFHLNDQEVKTLFSE